MSSVQIFSHTLLLFALDKQMNVSRILYVDDDADNCEVMALWLRNFDVNYDVTVINAGGRAMKVINEQSFDLYIFDFSMPEVDGADLCSFVRSKYPDSKIMIYSARADERHIKKGMAAGADQFLIKPNDFDRFLPTVTELLQRRQNIEN